MRSQQFEEAGLLASMRWAPWLLVAVGVLVYLNSLRGPFVLDDLYSIESNKTIRQLWPPLWLTEAPPNSTVNGRPLVGFTVALNYALGGLDVRGYRAVNLAVHILCALALFGVVRRTLQRESLRPRFGRVAGGIALACAMLWLLHPLQTECVNYISQRTESLMGLFYLLTLYCTLRGIYSPRHRWWYGAAVVSCALGMASKQVMVTAPLMVLLFDRVYGPDSFGQILRKRWGLYAGLASTWVVLAALMWSFPDTNAGLSDRVGPVDYAMNQCLVVVDYLRLAIWPHPLLLDYGYPTKLSIGDVAPYAALLAALLVATVAACVYRPMLGFVAGWIFVVLAPTSSFVPLASEVGAERRMYLPLAGLIVLGVVAGFLLLEKITKRAPAGAERWGRRVLVTAIAAALAWTTVERNHDYRSARSLWQTVVDIRPDNVRGHCMLGDALKDEGRLDEAIACYRRAVQVVPGYVKAHNNLGLALQSKGRLDEAIKHFRLALRGNPEYAESHYARTHTNLGNALTARGKTGEAIGHYRKALELRPDLAEAHSALGAALTLTGQSDEALQHLRKAVRLAPGRANLHHNLGTALIECGKPDEAIGHLQQALRLAPNLAEAHQNLGRALALTGQAAEALEHFQKAARLKPNWPAPVTRVAWILATHPDPTLRDEARALRLAERACKMTRQPNADMLDTLAAAYAAAGRFDRAVTTAQAALALATAGHSDALSRQIRKRLELYQQGQSYRAPSGAQADPVGSPTSKP